MTIITKGININSKGEDDMVDLTTPISEAVDETKLTAGIVTIFVAGSTAAVTTIEYEPGLKIDFPKMLSRIAPKDLVYEHDNTWHDGNGHSHVRASLIGASLTIPFKDNKLLLGRWQQVVLLEMDTRRRERKIILQIIGE
ncbi:MAG TPA: secondary thiamine-phosphate synthase enzyme YjbQ [Candidatus Nitrosopolaris sp.]|nr:secondary thiamine-phosphate synthase enzyme YjbQ [Candidatus Nitrosopolaris sp.]